jgi:hypothetical protein
MMVSLWKRLAAGALAVLLLFGSATMMTGCADDDDPIEEAADEMEEATD